MKFTKKRKMEFLYLKLRNDYRWAKRALIRIYEAQTQDERLACTTLAHNGVGFTAFDAATLTPLAIKAKAGITVLTPYEEARVKNRMPKYRKQILEISNPETLQQRMEEHYAPKEAQVAEDGTESTGHPERKSGGSPLPENQRQEHQEGEAAGMHHPCDGRQLLLWPRHQPEPQQGTAGTRS